MYGPVDHDVLVAAVTDLEEIGFVEKAKERRGNEMIVFRRMVIDLEHYPGVEIVVICKIGCDSDTGALPDRFFDVAVPDKSRFVGKEKTARFVIGEERRPKRRLVVAAIIRDTSSAHVENVSLAIWQIPSLQQSVELRREHENVFAVFFLFDVKAERFCRRKGVVQSDGVSGLVVFLHHHGPADIRERFSLRG